jgi:acyl-CoA thioester hydrolase
MPAPSRADFKHFLAIPTRWMDNDVYGHVNNVVFYSYFDTVINQYLVAAGGLDIQAGPAIGLCVESECHYLQPASFPDSLDAGLAVAHLGRSSVRYEIGLFARGADSPSAHGHFVHVFVSRATRRPLEIPVPLRGALARLQRAEVLPQR